MFSYTEPSPNLEDLSFSSSASKILSAQKPPATPVSWSSQLQKRKKSPTDHDNDRVTKYAKYFKDNEILPIPDLLEAVEAKILSFVGTDLRTRRLAGLRKESYEEVLKTAGISGRCFYRKSFATWDVLLQSEDIVKKMATNNITTKFFRLQPEYRQQRRIKVTVCNVSMLLDRDVLAAYLSYYGGVADYNLITSVHGTAFGDYLFTMILDMGGVSRPPTYRDTTMTLIVEGKRLFCWNCKQLGHFSRSCNSKNHHRYNQNNRHCYY